MGWERFNERSNERPSEIGRSERRCWGGRIRGMRECVVVATG